VGAAGGSTPADGGRGSDWARTFLRRWTRVRARAQLQARGVVLASPASPPPPPLPPLPPPDAPAAAAPAAAAAAADRRPPVGLPPAREAAAVAAAATAGGAAPRPAATADAGGDLARRLERRSRRRADELLVHDWESLYCDEGETATREPAAGSRGMHTDPSLSTLLLADDFVA